MTCPKCGSPMEHVPEEPDVNMAGGWNCEGCEYYEHEPRPSRYIEAKTTSYDRLDQLNTEARLAVRPLGIAD